MHFVIPEANGTSSLASPTSYSHELTSILFARACCLVLSPHRMGKEKASEMSANPVPSPSNRLWWATLRRINKKLVPVKIPHQTGRHPQRLACVARDHVTAQPPRKTQLASQSEREIGRALPNVGRQIEDRVLQHERRKCRRDQKPLGASQPFV